MSTGYVFELDELTNKIDLLVKEIAPLSLDDVFEEERDAEIEVMVEDIVEFLYNAALHEENIEKLIQKMIERYENEGFWEVIRSILEQSLEAFNDTKFLNSFDKKTKENLYIDVLNNILRQQDREEFIKSIGDAINLEQYMILVRLLNTCISQIVGYYVPKDIFYNKMKKLCNMKEEEASFLFDMIIDRRSELFNYFLARNIAILSDKLD